jgi:signal transduction histidine kinase
MQFKVKAMSNLNFQQRLAIGIVVFTILTTITLGIIGSRLSENFLLIRFRDRMDFLSKYLAANCELGILLDNREMLQRLATNLLREEDVIRVIIKTRSGEILAKAQGSDEPGHDPVQTPVLLSTQSENLAFGAGHSGKKILGTVKIYYNTTGIELLSHKLHMRYAVVTLLIAVGGIIAFLIFSRSLTSPLERLIEAAQDVAQGNLEVKLSEGKLPETEKLAHAFNTMTEALKQSRRDLEQTYQQLIQQKALAEIGHFSVTIAHEVKNPLGIIKGALDILKKDDIDRETRATMIDYVEDEVMRLNNLIQDFLEFSRPKPLSFHRVKVDRLLTDITDRMNLEWKPKGIEIKCRVSTPETGFTVEADADLLGRAVSNIIKNACEVSKSGQTVKVEIFRHGRDISIRITDHGPGINAEDRGRVLEPFFTTKAKGTGLGLAFAKRIIEAHMGQLTISSNHAAGTVFEIILG